MQLRKLYLALVLSVAGLLAAQTTTPANRYPSINIVLLQPSGGCQVPSALEQYNGDIYACDPNSLTWRSLTGPGGGGLSGTTGNIPLFNSPNTAGNSHLTDRSGVITSSEPVTATVNTEINVAAPPYNADPTYTTDSTAAFQAAWAACSTGTGQGSGCTVMVPAGHYKLNSGVIDLGSTTSANVDFRYFRGVGKATILDFQPSTTQAAGLRMLNCLYCGVKDISILANANVTYALLDTIENGGTSAENQDFDNIFIQGAQYGVGIGPDTNGDVSHYTLKNVASVGAVQAGFILGLGQANVLDGYCFGCTAEGSQYGVIYHGGGLGWYGGDAAHNSVADFEVAVVPDQPIVISGTRSEESASFMKITPAAGASFPPITIDSDQFNSGSLESDKCVISMSNDYSPLEIRNSFFGSTTSPGTIQFCLSPTLPTPVTMTNVATSDPNFAANLATLATNPDISFYSANDYIRSNGSYLPASGNIYWSPGNYFGNVSATGGLISQGGTLGPYQNLLLYSNFGSIGTTWTQSCSQNVTTTGGQTDPLGGTTAISMLFPNPATCAGGIVGLVQNVSPGLTLGHTYIMSVWMKGAVGGETGIWGLEEAPGYYGGAIVTNAWKRYYFSFTPTGFVGSSTVVVGGDTGAATIYYWGAQLEDVTTSGNISPGVYVANGANPTPATNGLYTPAIVDSTLSISSSPLCANGSGGAFTTSGCLQALPASLTTTAATSDNLTVTGMTSTGHCSITPTNASAATNLATTYISAKTTNQITVTHTATASMTYDFLCTAN